MTKKQISSKPKTTKVAIPDQPNALRRLKNSYGMIIAAFAFLLYAQSITFDYTLDDETVITSNKFIKEGISSIPTILTKDRLAGYENANYKPPEYRPLPLIMFAIEWQFFPNNPHIAHLINILLYSLVCWLLYLLLCKLFEKQNLIFPFVCSLLYVAHPIHTEVVDSIKSGDELLCFLFGILSILMTIKLVESKTKKDFILAGICYFFSLMSKETGIVFLIIIPLILYVFSPIHFKRIAGITNILILISCLFFIIRHLVLESITTNDFYKNNNALFLATDFISQRATAFYVLLKYLILLLIPYPLSSDYSYNQIPVQSISNPLTIISIIFYLSIGFYSMINIRKKSVMAFALLFYLLTLAPVSNILILIGSTMGERFLFIPSLGFCLAITLIIFKIVKINITTTKSIKELISQNPLLKIFIFILVGVYSIQTFSRSMDWKDNITLNSHDVEVSKNSGRLHFNLAGNILTLLYPKETIKVEQIKLLDRAIAEFEKGLEIKKDYGDAYLQIGFCYFKKEDYRNAIKYYEIANKLSEHPNINLINEIAGCYAKIGQFDKALEYINQAIKLDNNFILVHINKGLYLYQAGKLKESISENEMVLKLDPSNAKSYENIIGGIYKELGDTLKSKEFLEKAK